MLSVTNEGKILGHMQSYFNLLKQTGYVNDKMTFRYLLYLFLYDFTDSLYDFFSEEDYYCVEQLLLDIFSDGGCLLPYENFISDSIKIGTPRYEGHGIKRISEVLSGSKDRYTNDIDLRLLD